MNRTQFLLLLTKIIIMLMFLVYYFDNILIMALGFIVVNMLFNAKLFFNKLDKNNIIIILYALLLCLVLLVNLKNYEFVNLKEDFYYIKTAVNGFTWIALAYFGYQVGKILGENTFELNKFLKFCLTLFLINGIVNIFIWISTTGGIISRYSFVSPITNSVSAGILYSLLGFFIVQALSLKSSYLSFLLKVIFFINIIIIGTRQVQIFFALYLVYYYLLSFKVYKNMRIKLLIKALSITPVIFLVLIALLPTFAPMYEGIFDLGSQDYYVRQITQKVAVDLFLENPIFGIGYGMFGVYNTAIISAAGDTLGSTHNGFYSIISEWGILGILLTLGLFLNILSTSRKLLIRNNEKSKIDLVIIVFLRGVIFVFFVSNFDLFPPPNERNYYLYGFILWIMYGVITQKAFSNTDTLSKSYQRNS
jgi:O-antigen ligase